MGRKFGWRKSKYDPRAKLHRTATAVPVIFDLTRYIPPIRDQGDEGSCTGFGIGINVTSLLNMSGIPMEWFSPRDIYNGGKYMGGYLNDEGADPQDCLDWLKLKGCLPEHFWKYVAGQDSKKAPSNSLDIERAKFPVFDTARCVDGVDGICSAIAAGHPVSFGSPWFNKWMNPKGGILPTVKKTDSVAGGHETCLFAYNKNIQLFIGANSWSEIWGDKGKYYLPFSAINVIKSIEAYDAHIVEVKWVSTPPPTPIPIPVVQSLIRLQKSTDNGINWSDLYRG